MREPSQIELDRARREWRIACLCSIADSGQLYNAEAYARWSRLRLPLGANHGGRLTDRWKAELVHELALLTRDEEAWVVPWSWIPEKMVDAVGPWPPKAPRLNTAALAELWQWAEVALDWLAEQHTS